jgi:cation transport ATPase
MECDRNSELREWEISLLTSLAFTIPLAILHFTSMQSMDGGEDDNMTTAMHEDLLPSVKDWLCLLLATPVQFGVGRRFYQNAYRGLVHGRTMGMDFLVAMGTPSAYLYSVIVFVLCIIAADQDDVEVDCEANAHVQDRRLANHVRHAGEVPRGVREGGDCRRALHAYEIATRIGDACRASPGSCR